MKKKEKKLTVKESKFIDAYIATSGNGAAAARKAGYSKKTAKETAYENLTKPHIARVLEQKAKTAAEKLGITPEYVLGNFKEIAEFNKKKTLKSIIKKGQDGSLETSNKEEMIDAQAAIRSTELLGKHLNLFSEKSEVKVEIKDESFSEERQKILAQKIALLLQNPKNTPSQ